MNLLFSCFYNRYASFVSTLQLRVNASCHLIWPSLVAKRLKRLPPMWETWVRSLGREDSLEKEMSIHSSILAWRIPGTGEPGGLPSTGSHRVGHDWSNLAAAEEECSCKHRASWPRCCSCLRWSPWACLLWSKDEVNRVASHFGVNAWKWPFMIKSSISHCSFLLNTTDTRLPWWLRD